MTFDIVVGNPPFQETHADGTRKAPSCNLWSKFWSKAIGLTRDDGTVALITPLRWMNPGPDLSGEWRVNGHSRLWDIFNQYSSRANVRDVARHFPGVGSTFGYVVVDKSADTGLVFSDAASTALGFMPVSGHETVYQQLSLDQNIGSHFTVDQNNRAQLRVSIPMTRVLNSRRIETVAADSNPVGGAKSLNNYTYIYVNDLDEAERVRARIIDCIDILNRHCRYSGFMSREIVKMIRYNA